MNPEITIRVAQLLPAIALITSLYHTHTQRFDRLCPLCYFRQAATPAMEKTMSRKILNFEQEAQITAAAHRKLQEQVARSDKKSPKEETKKAMQAGARPYPEPPMVKQHLEKPGTEADLRLAPMCEAPYYKGSEKLKDKVAIITGGDSGIGRAVAILYAREGADVAIVYLHENEDAQETKRMIEAEGRRCLLFSGDVTDRIFCQHAVDATIAAFGKLDVLVNNAAFQLHVSRFEDLTEEHFDRTLKTNLYGYFHMAQIAVEHMKPGSAIVNTGSVTGLMGNKDLLDYSLTKGGIHAFTRSLATHLIPRQRRRPRPGMDAPQPRRQRHQRHRPFRRRHPHETPRPARRNRPGLRIPRIAALLQLHHRRNPADHRRL
jgi:NADP-dependent 3-hydroxy acid dehydrogenase YdfG